MIAQVVKFIDRSGKTADTRLRVFSKGGRRCTGFRERERDSAMSSSGGASLVTLCMVGNVTQNASDTRQHCEPPPDE